MQAIRTLIADDEPLARALLEGYLEKLPQCVLAGSCKNALEAFAVLSTQSIDLLLLDINMPEITGIDFLKTLKAPPLVIFTTAYADYAVQSYEHRAVDYLLKPITFSRFVQAINKVEEALKPEAAGAAESSAPDMLFVKSEGKMIRLNTGELYFIEGYKNYVRLWTGRDKIILHNTMKAMEEHFCNNAQFLRISKSYIVNLKFVSEVDGNCIRVGTETLMIGATYRDEVKELLERYYLK